MNESEVLYEQIEIKGATFYLLPEKVLYWAKYKLLVISDVHLGKASHFRKNGIAVPGSVLFDDLRKISEVLSDWDVKTILFLGDLFHSDLNSEWRIFEEWRHSHQDIEMILVEGNHDILASRNYETANLNVVGVYRKDRFTFTHEKELESGFYNFSGHVHPCVRLSGAARQSLRLPCFYFSNEHALLPAFGNFTGTHRIKVYAEDRVFCIANNQIISLAS